jgi:hypothetical protein
MADNQYVNKVVLANGTTLIDLTQDDVTASDVLSGIKFHMPSGEAKTGTCTYDADTSDATASASEILNTKTAYKNGTKLTGSMPNRGGVTGTISTKAGQYTIQSGYHDGSGKVSIDSVEQAKIIAGNIKSGVTILGVEGDYTGEAISARTADVTPTFSAQTILPGTGYDYLSQVNVAAITVTETDNSAGGKTVTIGAA